ncbi:ATP-binding protein [Kineococcus sp. SYSU DK002]|uniref:ATP-binding protein n=1 Tax=Kineococcus sp. SYSU DK002 TaxID=3383123 RepID=UPI003D7E509B
MTRRGVHRLLALVLALAMVSVTPTVVANLATGPAQAPGWWTAPLLAAYLAVFAWLVLHAVRRTRPWRPVWALVLLGDAALGTYPLVAGHPDEVPWVLALSPLTVGAGAVAVPSLWGALGLTGAHLALRLALQLSGVWTVPGDIAVLDAVGLLVIGTATSVAVLSVRAAAGQVETARAAAERAAAEAAAARAVEVEDSRWDGIVHDDVLASLSLTAHAHDGADRVRARAAAGRALTSIAHDPDGEPGPVPVAEAAARLSDRVLSAHPRAELTLPGRAGGRVEPEALEALQSAAVEACRNAVRHGRPGGVPTVRVRVRTTRGRDGDRLSVEVRDDGVGFDPRTATPRLGLAVSVRRRADVVGGRALVRSLPGVGTVVLLSVPVVPGAPGGTEAPGASGVTA